MRDREQEARIGQRITEARLLAGLTQQELATHLGWPVSTLGNYESGRRALRVTQLLTIAEALDCAAATLLVADSREVTLLERLAARPERWEQVRLFLDALDADDA